jgi:hypothetical protein
MAAADGDGDTGSGDANNDGDAAAVDWDGEGVPELVWLQAVMRVISMSSEIMTDKTFFIFISSVF